MFKKVDTVMYPEDKRPTAPRFHGHHQLNRWPDGLEKCIGCELCAWACPADAIYVEGRDNTEDGRFSPGAHDDQRVRDRRRQPGEPHLDQGAAASPAAPQHGGPAAPDAARQGREGLLPPRGRRGSGSGEREIMHLFLANGGPGGTNLDPLYDTALFWILAVLSVSAAVAMILVRHAVHCALMLAIVMLCLAVMYAMQGAPFLAFVQVIVYTGAVLMLFLFVFMLIGTNSSESLTEVIRGQRLWAALAAICLAVLLIVGIGHAAIGSAAPSTAANSTNNLSGLARLIFTTYVFP